MEKEYSVSYTHLDVYKRQHESHDLQKEWFIRQLELARKHNLPVLIHSREAAADTMEIMKGHAQGLNGVIHLSLIHIYFLLQRSENGVRVGVRKFCPLCFVEIGRPGRIGNIIFFQPGKIFSHLADDQAF